MLLQAILQGVQLIPLLLLLLFQFIPGIYLLFLSRTLKLLVLVPQFFKFDYLRAVLLVDGIHFGLQFFDCFGELLHRIVCCRPNVRGVGVLHLLLLLNRLLELLLLFLQIAVLKLEVLLQLLQLFNLLQIVRLLRRQCPLFQGF